MLNMLIIPLIGDLLRPLSFQHQYVIASPVRALVQQDVAAKLFGSNSKAKRKSSSARNSGTVKTSKKRPYANPETTLLWFLHESFVDANASTLDGKN